MARGTVGSRPHGRGGRRARPEGAGDMKAALITGGAGFIGTNLADRLAGEGRTVYLYDNLSRPGVVRNLYWLQQQHGERIRFIYGDVRNANLLREAVQEVDSVFHLAAQVAVTTSLVTPVVDFEVNARGTLNVLEAVRAARKPPRLIYTSTNKVLGGLEHVRLRESETRYEPEDPELCARGIGESQGLDFCSPYGCSKGAADQYVLDYARVYGIPACVFRMSCIYGPHQCGNEDQGWVAHFLLSALSGREITFYGDGKQVRDALYVDDLIEAFSIAERDIGRLTARAFNIGGSPANTTSLLELVQLIGELHGQGPLVRKEDWRPSDQRYFVSDTRPFEVATGWRPSTGVAEGVRKLYHWLRDNAFETPPFFLPGQAEASPEAA
ncbi:MAG: SDR family NAD(P)-dependent oxidoreductase [Deltaproteobacteria bacterium]|nr:SDR family NAD(P)-dependent oxidoreductase [Deltaproteobacteria bacterium]